MKAVDLALLALVDAVQQSLEENSKMDYEIICHAIELVEDQVKCHDFGAFEQRLLSWSGDETTKCELLQAVSSSLRQLLSLDDLYNFFSRIEALIIDETSPKVVQTLSKTSVFGVFVRRCVAKFKMFSFEESVALFDQLAVFLDTKQTRLKPSISEDETGVLLRAKLANEAPLDFKSKLDIISSKFPRQVQAHYAHYLHYVEERDFERALDSLHRFLDYGLARSEDKAALRNYAFALLALGVLHSVFGHSVEAKRILFEAVRVSRRSQNAECLNYALCWLGEKVENGADGDLVDTLEACVQLKASKDALFDHPSALFDTLFKSDDISQSIDDQATRAKFLVLQSAVFKHYDLSPLKHNSTKFNEEGWIHELISCNLISHDFAMYLKSFRQFVSSNQHQIAEQKLIQRVCACPLEETICNILLADLYLGTGALDSAWMCVQSASRKASEMNAKFLQRRCKELNERIINQVY